MKKISASVYKETYYVLKKYPDLLKCIPNKILKHVEREASKSKQSIQLNEKQEVLLQISKDSLALCIYFYMKYGNLSEVQREKMKELLVNNEIKMHHFYGENNNTNDILNSVEKDLNSDIVFREKEIIKQVKLDAEEKIKQYITEDELGYEHYLYKEMKKVLDEKGIAWTPYNNGVIQ